MKSHVIIELCLYINYVRSKTPKISIIPSAVNSSLVIKTLKEPECDQKKMKNIKNSGAILLDDDIKISKIIKALKKPESDQKKPRKNQEHLLVAFWWMTS